VETQGQLAPRYQYETLFGTKPKQIDQIYRLPLERGDHSEMDTTELLDANYMQTYQYLIPVGSMQWAMPLGLLYAWLGKKKRATVETALNGSECARSQTCVNQDICLRSPLRYLENPIYNKACMFRKNELVVNGSSTARVKPIGYYHIRSEANPSNVLSKHCGYSQVWILLRCVLSWRGDTALLLTEQQEQEG
jgi:hypothetical protein